MCVCDCDEICLFIAWFIASLAVRFIFVYIEVPVCIYLVS